MSLLTVNVLPDQGTVNRALDHVYKWYQTNSLVFPFDSLPTAVLHGYFVLNYQVGVDVDGFKPDADANGWIQLAEDELPYEFTPHVAKYSYISQFTMIEHGKEFAPYVPVEVSRYELPVLSSLTEVAVTGIEPTLFTTLQSEWTVGVVKVPIASPTVDYTISSLKVVYVGEETPLSISHVGKIETYAYTTFFDVSRVAVDYTTLPLYISAVPEVEYSRVPINFVFRGRGKIEVFSDELEVDVTSIAINYAAHTDLDIPGIVPKVGMALPSSFDISKYKVIHTGEQSDFSISDREWVPAFSPEVDIDVSIRVPVEFSAYTSAFIAATNTSTVYTLSHFNVLARNTGVTQSSVSLIPVAGSYSINKTHSGALSVHCNASSKLFAFSGSTAIDISYTGEVRVLTEQDWIMFKRFGTKGWKFLSYLDYYEDIKIESDMELDVMSNYFAVLEASALLDIQYDSNNTNNITRVTKYSDALHTVKVEDVVISYISGLPVEVETTYFNQFNQKITTITEDLVVVNTPDPTLSSGGYNVVQHVNSLFDEVLDVDPSVSELDVVYLDTSGYLQTALADNVTTAVVVGLVAGLPATGKAGIVSSGLLHGFAGLVIGDSYYLSSTTTGSITNVVPTSTGHVSKKVGVAATSSSLLVNLHTPLIIRA